MQKKNEGNLRLWYLAIMRNTEGENENERKAAAYTYAYWHGNHDDAIQVLEKYGTHEMMRAFKLGLQHRQKNKSNIV